MSEKLFLSHRQAGTRWEDIPYRRCKRDEQTNELVPITDAGWASGEWYDVTSLDDPTGVHVYIDLTIGR